MLSFHSAGPTRLTYNSCIGRGFLQFRFFNGTKRDSFAERLEIQMGKIHLSMRYFSDLFLFLFHLLFFFFILFCFLFKMRISWRLMPIFSTFDALFHSDVLVVTIDYVCILQFYKQTTKSDIKLVYVKNSTPFFPTFIYYVLFLVIYVLYVECRVSRIDYKRTFRHTQIKRIFRGEF